MLPKICCYGPIPDDNANNEDKNNFELLENQGIENWILFLC